MYTFKSIHEQLDNLKNSGISNKQGVYRVYIPKNFEVEFECPCFGNADCDECKQVLEKAQKKYNANIGIEDDGRQLVYIGKAKNLRRRLKQYVKYGYGECNNHKGGRLVFAIRGWEDFIIEYKELAKNEANEEADLIDAFETKYNALPFANLIHGHHGSEVAEHTEESKIVK